MTYNQQLLPTQKFNLYFLLVQSSHSSQYISQMLGRWQKFSIDMLKSFMIDWVARIFFKDFRRSDHKTAPPFVNHLFSIHINYFELIQSLCSQKITWSAPQNFSFSSHRFSTGTQCESIQSKMKLRVFIDLVSREEQARSNYRPAFLIILPHYLASYYPFGESFASNHPAHCLNWLCCVCPCRTITNGKVLILCILGLTQIQE